MLGKFSQETVLGSCFGAAWDLLPDRGLAILARGDDSLTVGRKLGGPDPPVMPTESLHDLASRQIPETRCVVVAGRKQVSAVG